MQSTRLLPASAGLIFSLLLVSGCGSDDSSTPGTDRDSNADASYRVSFVTAWTSADFPTNYPGNAHFTDLVGATHNDQVVFWEEGGLASPGIEEMAETGNTGLMSSEVATAKAQSTAQFALGGSSAGGSDTVSFEFDINVSHSRVTLVTMVAPSPDWFVGVHGLDLFDSQTGSWKDSETVGLAVYDAGTEDGVGFSLNNPASNPQQAISLLSSNPGDTDFASGVHRNSGKYIAKMIFTKIK